MAERAAHLVEDVFPVVPPRDRARLERLCRYALRPPIATDRLHLTADGHAVLDLRHRWADGTRSCSSNRWSCSNGWRR